VPSFQRFRSHIRVAGAFLAPHSHNSFTERKNRLPPVVRALFALAPLLSALPAAAQEQERHPAMPTTVFAQAGVAAKETQMLVVGATRDWAWEKELSFGRATGYWEVSLGRWHSEGRGSQWVGQVGVTPVLRLHPRRWGEGWFIEGGIGANLLYRLQLRRSHRGRQTLRRQAATRTGPALPALLQRRHRRAQPRRRLPAATLLASTVAPSRGRRRPS
jgi:hypothetical protein